MAAGVVVHPSIEAALRDDRPVVALESAVITHGLPREPLRRTPSAADGRWQPDSPTNLELARLLERIVAAHGALPATCAVLDGELRVGLDEGGLCALASARSPAKAAARDLAWCVVTGASAGLTVAGTLEACRLASRPARHRGGDGSIRAFATGGIGGAHRGWSTSADISADLHQLTRCDVCVVSSGAKSILDVAATMELLDTLGVPLVGCGTDCMPRFVCPPDPALPLPARLDEPTAIADLCRARWRALDQRGAVLVVQPVRADLAIDAQQFEGVVTRAEEAARARTIRGSEVTPFLLREVARLTQGRSLDANVALLAANAALAAEIAKSLAGNVGSPARFNSPSPTP